MANTLVKNSRRKGEFKQNTGSNPFETFGERASLSDKMKILEELGRPELVEVFKDWTPRQARRRRTGAPLDQRVAITVTNQEKYYLEMELKTIRSSGDKITASKFIRNRAMGSVDIHGWRETARKALAELDDLSDESPALRSRRRQLMGMIEDAEDAEDEGMYEIELASVNAKLEKLIATNEKRKNRLTGRMSMAEAETVRWRAQRLCLSSSDYLRMMIFGLEPNTHADAHMSLDARRRFYISIIDVAQNGWGSPPNHFECSQCVNYLDEIDRLRDRVKQLETFA